MRLLVLQTSHWAVCFTSVNRFTANFRGSGPLQFVCYVERVSLRPRAIHVEVAPVLWTLLVVILILWALGMVGNIGSLVHLLLLLALVVLLVQIITGRRAAL